MTLPMAPPTPTQTLNVTSGFADSMQLTGVVVLVIYVLVALVAAQVFLPWLARSRLITGTAQRFITSLEYAIKGVATTVVLLAAAAPVYLVVTADPGTRSTVGRYAIVIIGGYLFLVVVGWLADNATRRFVAAHPDIDELSDLWAGDDDEDAEEAPGVAD